MSFSAKQIAEIKKKSEKLCDFLSESHEEVGEEWRNCYEKWSDAMKSRLTELAKGNDVSTVTRYTWVNTGDMSKTFFALCEETKLIGNDLELSTYKALDSLAKYSIENLPIPSDLFTKKRLMVKIEDFRKGGAYHGTVKPAGKSSASKPTKASGKKKDVISVDDESSQEATRKPAKKSAAKKSKPATKSSSKKSVAKTPPTVPKKSKPPSAKKEIKKRKIQSVHTDYDSDASCCTLPPTERNKETKEIDDMATKLVALEAARQSNNVTVATAIFKEKELIEKVANFVSNMEVNSSVVQFIDAIMRTLRLWLVTSIDDMLAIKIPSEAVNYSLFISTLCDILINWLSKSSLEPFISDIFCDSKGLILSSAIEDVKCQIPAVGDLIAAVIKTASNSSSPIWKSFYRIAPSPDAVHPPELGSLSAVMCVPTFS